MSDFISGFWSYYIGVAVVISIAACLWLLWATGAQPDPAHRHAGEEPAQVGNHRSRLG